MKIRITNYLNPKPTTPSHEKEITELPPIRMLFAIWVALLIMFILIIIVGVLCDWTGFKLSAQGLSNFIKLIDVPIKLTGGALAFAALIALNHRSGQTAKQIKVNQEQNIFNNHYRHIEFFTDYSNKLESPKIKAPEVLHSNLYPNTLNGDYSIDDGFLQRLVKLFKILERQIAILSEGIEKQDYTALKNLFGLERIQAGEEDFNIYKELINNFSKSHIAERQANLINRFKILPLNGINYSIKIIATYLEIETTNIPKLKVSKSIDGVALVNKESVKSVNLFAEKLKDNTMLLLEFEFRKLSTKDQMLIAEIDGCRTQIELRTLDGLEN